MRVSVLAGQGRIRLTRRDAKISMILKDIVKYTIPVLVFITTVSGAIWAIGKPPFANENEVNNKFEEVNQQYAGFRAQYLVDKEDSLERRIFDLEVEKRKAGNTWPTFMERELQRLKIQRDRLKKDIDRLKK